MCVALSSIVSVAVAASVQLPRVALNCPVTVPEYEVPK